MTPIYFIYKYSETRQRKWLDWLNATRVQITSRPGFKTLPADVRHTTLCEPLPGSSYRERFGPRFHSKTITSKPPFSNHNHPSLRRLGKFQGKSWELNLPYIEWRSQLNPNPSLLSKHISLKSWLLHLSDDLELYQPYSPILKWNHPFIPSLAFPEHLLSVGLYAKFGGSDRPKAPCLSLENSANQEWYRWSINMIPWKELPHPQITPAFLGQDLARPDLRGEASGDQVPLGAATLPLQQGPCQEETPGPSPSSIMWPVDTHAHLEVGVACWWRAHEFIIQHLPCVKCRDTLERGKQPVSGSQS